MAHGLGGAAQMKGQLKMSKLPSISKRPSMAVPNQALTSELIWHFRQFTIPTALALLPGRMNTPEARAMLFATGLQESNFNARRQGGRGTRPGHGPARSFWQFEQGGGVVEVLTSPDTASFIQPICRMFLYEPTPAIVHAAMEHHDVLAACMARLLLYRDPRPLPSRNQSDLGWSVYVQNWRPGKPHPEKWPTYFTQAWQIVTGDS